MPDRDLHGLDAARIGHRRLCRLGHRIDDSVGALVGVISRNRDQGQTAAGSQPMMVSCNRRQRKPCPIFPMVKKLTHGIRIATRYRMAFLPISCVNASISAQPLVGTSTQKESRVGPRLSASPHMRIRSGGGSLGSKPAGFNPRIDLRLEEPDPAPSVPRKANPLWKPVVAFPTPQRLACDVKLFADFLHRIKPIHPNALLE